MTDRWQGRPRLYRMKLSAVSLPFRVQAEDGFAAVEAVKPGPAAPLSTVSRNELMRTASIEYSRIAAQNPLFLTLLEKAPDSGPFVSPIVDPADLRQRAGRLLAEGRAFPRREVADVVEAFHRRLGSPDRVLSNIERLRSPETLCIVTGQQVGFLGGAALSVYKALTAVMLADRLSREGYTVVPVFWLASDDSDFQEVRSTAFLRRGGGLLHLAYPGPGQNDERMAGSFPLTDVGPLLDRLEAEALEGDFRAEIIAMLRRTYRPDRTFREGFAAWLDALFGAYGLVQFDPLEKGYKQTVQSVFQTAVKRCQDILAELDKTNELLQQSGFTSQVQVSASDTLLFLVQDYRRFKIDHLNGQYRVRNSNQAPMSECELLAEIHRNPDAFAPNVLLRPVLQDHLFPTVVYVGGPAEIAYFSQVVSISRFWDVVPAVSPRVGITVVDRKAQRYSNGFGVSAEQILEQDPLFTLRRILAGKPSGQVLQDLTDLKSLLQDRLASIKRNIDSVDPPVGLMLQRAQKKIFYQIDKVENRFLQNRRRRSDEVGRKLGYLYDCLCPEQKLQERVINFNQFLVQEGLQAIPRLMDTVRLFSKEHQIIYV
jgi:bacillithiol synthase